MVMRLLRLAIENYKCFQDRTEINFTAGRVEPGRNIFLIGGMNGTGKTAIMEAINFCLYGEKKAVMLKDGMNKEQENKHNVRCSIELSFETDEGSDVTVRRSWTAHALFPPPSADELIEDLTVVVDGNRTSGMSEERWAEYRDSLIPQTVAQFFFFDGEKIQQIVADKDSKKTLTESMEAVLGIRIVRKLIDDLRKIQITGKKARCDTSEKDIDWQKKQLEAFMAKLAKKKELVEKARHDMREFEAELGTLEKSFSERFSPDQKDGTKRDELTRQEMRLENQLSQIHKHLREFAERILPLSLLATHLPDLRRQLEAEQKAVVSAAVKDEADALAAAIVEAAAYPNTVCCREKMSQSAREELRNRVLAVIRHFPEEPARAEEHLELLQLSPTDAARVLDRINEIERSDSAGFSALFRHKAELAFELENVKEQVKKASVADSDKEAFDRLQSEIKSYSTQLGKKRDEESRYIDECREIEKEIEEQQCSLDRAYRELSVTKEHDAFLKQCQGLIDLFTEYVDLLRESKILTLQERTFEMYRRLASKGDLIESVHIDPESYRVTIKNLSGQEVAKHNLSAGEKEVFAISLLWGLAQTSELELPVVIDTPLSRLDSKHRDRIVTDYFPNAALQVVVLSTDTEVDRQHFSKLAPHLQNSIRLQFDKTRKLTTIEEGYFWE